MSYILDALKKAEAERRIGTNASSPASLPAADSMQYAHRKAAMRSPWPWVAMTAVAALLAAYSWLRQPPVVPPVAQHAPVPVAAAQAQQAVASPLPAEPQQQAIQPATAPAQPAIAESPPEEPKPRSAKRAKPAGKKHADAEKKTAEPAAPPPPPTLRELPDNIQREIPQLSVGGYIYSGSKADRSVLINGRLLHEGEEAAPGLILEKMMPNGMVLNYKGYRYRAGY